jgi:hypothetical protein
MTPHVEFMTNLPLLQLWMALMVDDAEITISNAANIPKLRKVGPKLRKVGPKFERLEPREFSGIFLVVKSATPE